MTTKRPGAALAALIVAVAALVAALVAPISPASAQTEPTAPADSAPAAESTRSTGSVSIWRVYVDDPSDGQRLANGDYDLLEGKGDGYLYVLGENDVAVSLRQEGFRVELDRELSALPGVAGRDRSGALADGTEASALAATYYGGYRTVDEHYQHLSDVQAAYPGLATVYDYGDSWRKLNGRAGANELMVICLTNIEPGDCALNPSSAKPRAVIQAAIHARELQTSEMAWRLIDHLTQNYGSDPDVTHMMDTTEIWVIPVVNPDGREIVESGGNNPYMQRKNANDTVGNCSVPPTTSNHHGVDLNRNASTHNWGGIGTSTNPCAQTYPGTSGASEPEQQGIESLFRSLWPDQNGPVDDGTATAPDTTTGTFITMHSSGQLILLPPGDSGLAPNNTQLRAYAYRMSHYNGYETGTGPEILYGVTGSTDDWVYNDLGVASVTYELSPSSGTCGGFAPAYSCMEPLWNLNRDALLYAVKVAETPYITSRGPTTTSVSNGGSVEVGEDALLTAVVNDNAYGTNGVSRPSADTVTAAEYYLDTPPSDGGSPVAMASSDGSFNETNETVTASIDTSGLDLGEHTVYVRGRNANGFWGPVQATSFTVTPVVDDPPVADDQSVFTPEDTPVAITLTATDPEGQALTYTVTSAPANGSLTGTAPNLTYTPNAGYSGADGFTFTADDGANTSAPATVSISVGVPVGPIHTDDFETDQGWVTDPDGTDTATTGQWEVTDPAQTSSGIVLQLGTTTSGTQALVTDGAAGTSAGSFDIDSGDTTVRSPDIALPAGATLELSFQYYLATLSNATADDYLRVTVVGSGGSTTVLDEVGDGTERAASWTPFSTDISSYAGQTVHLLVEAADAGGGSLVEAAMDDLLIESVGAPNSPPAADAQSVTVDEDGSVAVTLTGSDPDGDPLGFSVASDPANGSLTGTAPDLTYTPALDVNGSDSFTFTVDDGTVNSAPATVSITINPINDGPTVAPVLVSTAQDTPVAITLDGDDVDGDPLTFSVVSGPTDGSLSGTAPNLTYTPDAGFVGTDSFQYTADDGTVSSAPASVTITVTEVNEAPTADDQSVALDEDTPVAITLTASDPEGDPLSFSVASGPANGTLSGTAPNLTYTPDANVNGSDSFTFVANDGALDSNEATISLTIAAVNDPPASSSITTSTDSDTPTGITLLGSDIDGDPLTFAVVSPPANGSLSGTAPNVTYTPNAGFVGTDSFQYTVNDGTVSSTPSTVTITVNPVSSLPFDDDFEAGAGNWSSLFGPGTWAPTTAGGSTWFAGSVSDGRDSSARTAGDTAWADYSVDVDVVTSNVLRRGDGPGVLARVVDAGNHYVFRFDNRRWVIEEVVNGSSTKLAQSARTSLGSGTVQLRAEVEGSNLRLFVNGSLVTTAISAAHPNGAVGLAVYGSVSRFDNVAVAALP